MFYGFYNFNAKYILNDLDSNEGLSISVKFKLSEEDIFQLFYRDSITKLNERLSKKIKVNPSSDSQWISFLIPDSLNLMQIRFDFGNGHKVTPVEISEFKFELNGNVFRIERDSILSYFKKNEYVTTEQDGTFGRRLIGKKSDPFLLSNDLRPIIQELENKERDNSALLNIALSSILSLSIIVGLFLKINTKQQVLGIEHVFVIMFFVLISLPIFGSVFSLDSTQVQEKRKLTTKPVLVYEEISKYPKEFESYFSDHFGFRKAMISFGGLLKAKILHTSPTKDKVIIGKNGWLFYWNKDIQLSYKNERPWAQGEDHKMKLMLEGTQNWAKAHNKYFLATIYPNKHSVYEEELPKRIRNLKRDTIDRTIQTINLFNKLQIPHVELLETFRKKSTQTQLFYKNDTHWNSNGAFCGYTAIMSQISKEMTEVSAPLRLDEFIYEENKAYNRGDLLDFMGIDNRRGYFLDTGFSYRPIKETKFKTHKDYLGPRTILIVNESLREGKTLLVIGDSFNNDLLKFLPLNFRATYFVRDVRMDLKWMDKVNPDIILYGIVERNLENF